MDATHRVRLASLEAVWGSGPDDVWAVGATGRMLYWKDPLSDRSPPTDYYVSRLFW